MAVVGAVNTMLSAVQNPKAPNVPKMAVYVTGGRTGQRPGNALYSYTLEALFTRSKALGNFKVIERSEAFTRQIDREQITQRSGHIDDGQISRLGRQYGIEWILIANMDYAMNNYNISARIINVETATVEKASKLHHANNELSELGFISAAMVEEMMGLTRAEETQRAEARAAAQARVAKENRNTIIGGLIGLAALVGILIYFNANAEKKNEKNRI